MRTHETNQSQLTRKLSVFQASTTRNGRIGRIGSSIRHGVGHHIDSIRSSTITKSHGRLLQSIFSVENGSANFGMLDTVNEIFLGLLHFDKKISAFSNIYRLVAAVQVKPIPSIPKKSLSQLVSILAIFAEVMTSKL